MRTTPPTATTSASRADGGPRTRRKTARRAQTSTVVGYIRVSTEEQGDSGAGLSAQELSIRADIKRREWELLSIHSDIASGKSRTKRPGLDAALEAVRGGSAGTLMVAKLDRLSRSLVDFAAIMKDAREGGWNLVALDLGVDLSTPAGEFLANVMASAAQWERRIIGQRTSDALRAKQASGTVLGRPTTIDDDTVTLIRQRREAGDSYATIAAHLNRETITPPQHGKCWYASSVRSVFLRFAALAGSVQPK